MPATPPPTTSVPGWTAVVSGTAASGKGTPRTAQAITDLARAVPTPVLAPNSRNEASRTSSGSPPACAIAAVNAGLKNPGESPAITMRSSDSALISFASVCGDQLGQRPQVADDRHVGQVLCVAGQGVEVDRLRITHSRLTEVHTDPHTDPPWPWVGRRASSVRISPASAPPARVRGALTLRLPGSQCYRVAVLVAADHPGQRASAYG